MVPRAIEHYTYTSNIPDLKLAPGKRLKSTKIELYEADSAGAYSSNPTRSAHIISIVHGSHLQSLPKSHGESGVGALVSGVMSALDPIKRPARRVTTGLAV